MHPVLGTILLVITIFIIFSAANGPKHTAYNIASTAFAIGMITLLLISLAMCSQQVPLS